MGGFAILLLNQYTINSTASLMNTEINMVAMMLPYLFSMDDITSFLDNSGSPVSSQCFLARVLISLR